MAKAIREADGKALLFKCFETLVSSDGLGRDLDLPFKAASEDPDTNVSELLKEKSWLQSEVGCR